MNGRVREGTDLLLTEDEVRWKERASGAPASALRQEVEFVQFCDRTSGGTEGLMYGLIIGMPIGGSWGYMSGKSDDAEWLGAFGGALIGASGGVVGALVGFGRGTRDNFFLTGHDR
jgi:hypothetical protein